MMAGAAAARIHLRRLSAYSDGIATNFSEMRSEETMTDFCIVTPSRKLPCHRVILAANSPVLKAAILSDMAEKKSCEITLDHIETEDMEAILQHMYKGDVSIDLSQLQDVLLAADYLQMAVLKEECIDYIPANIKLDNVISWYQLAYKLSLQDVMAQCSRIISSCMTDVANTQEFLSLSLSELQDCISTLLREDVDRDELLQALMAWSAYKSLDRSPYLADLLTNIHIEDCSPDVLRGQMITNAALLDSGPEAYKLFAMAAFGVFEKTGRVQRRRGKNSKKVLAMVGGYDNDNATNNTDCWFLHLQKQEMMKLTQIPGDTCTSWHSACKTEEGFAVTGGEKSAACMQYNTSTNSWSQLPSMLSTRRIHGSISFKRQLYVVGGRLSDPGTKSASVNYLDTDGKWQHGPDLPTAMAWPKLAVTEDDRLYVFDGETKQLFVLSENMKSWQQLASLPGRPCTRNRWAMAAVNRKLYVAGGQDTPSLDCYSPATDTWIMATSPTHGHCFGPLVHFEQRLYLLGGSWGKAGSDVVEEYDMERKAWQPSKIMLPKSLCCHSAMLLELQEEKQS